MGYFRESKAIAEMCKKIEMSYFTQRKLLKSNDDFLVTFEWSDGNLEIEVVNSEYPKYLILSYKLSSEDSPEGVFYRYRVSLTEQKSNLGKGIVYYFKCPQTKDKCRVLYFAYRSHLFKSRLAYPQRIYYKIQTVNSSLYPFFRITKIKELIKNVDKARMKTVYNGQETKTIRRLERLRMELNKYQKRNLQNAVIKIVKQNKGVGG